MKSATKKMIGTPYLDGIRTHRGKVKSVIRPPLYLQATTAGLSESLVHQTALDYQSYIKITTAHKQKLYDKKETV